VYLEKDESNTLRLINWFTKQKDWKREKFWRKENGMFSYKMVKDKEKFESCLSYIIMFEDTANIDGCVITKKTITQEIFVTDCENESTKF
jgi:hypothetical protein